MISIQRPASPPEPLASNADSACAEVCAAFDAGLRPVPINEVFYNAAEIRRSLADAQHRKCAYCESHIGVDGTIDHFRPKAASQQKRGGTLTRPGYYWLAYEWTNLLLACWPCNSMHKRNLFPLENPRRRARNHRSDTSREQPLLIDPSEEDPSQHLKFQDEFILPNQNSRRGAETIAALRLDRETLTEDRRSHLRLLRDLSETRQMLLKEMGDSPVAIAEANRLEKSLDAYCADEQRFAAMVRAAAARNYRPYSEAE